MLFHEQFCVNLDIGFFSNIKTFTEVLQNSITILLGEGFIDE